VEHNKENAHTKLAMLVLALGGERGFGQRVVRSMQALAENVRGGVIERCGHWIAEERPDELLAQLLTFFGKSKANYDTTGAYDVDGV
jgi:pimeloyl-ACP methyl ester carboxylesterase